jgi:hypothetical protein
LTTLTEVLHIEGNTKLTTLTVSSLKSVGVLVGSYNNMSINIQNNGLTGLSFPALTLLSGGLNVDGNVDLTSLTASSLNTAQDITISNNVLLSDLNLSALATLSGGINIQGNTKLTTLTVSSLNSVGTSGSSTSININNNGLTSLSFPELTALTEQFKVTNNTSLKTLNISALSKIPRLDASQNKLSNIIWASQIDSWSDINLQSNILPSTEINEILSLLVTAGQSGGNGFVILQTQTPPAPPTGQGITDKNTLIGWYLYVSTDN